MGKSTTEENLKLKKSLRTGRYLAKKDSYKDYFHWQPKEPNPSSSPTQPYIELSKKQLKSAKTKRLKSLLVFFLAFGILVMVIFAFLHLSWSDFR